VQQRRCKRQRIDAAIVCVRLLLHILIPQRQRRVTASVELRDRGFVAAAQPDS